MTLNGVFSACRYACKVPHHLIIGLVFFFSWLVTDVSFPTSLVETGATIMCSSMPALASLSRTLAAHSSYYASIRSKISRRYGQPASPSKVSLSNISSTSNNYTSTESSSKPYHQGGGAYIELSGRHTNSHYVGTTVYGGGAPAQGTHDVEKGAITKSVCIDQSSDRNSFT